MSKNKNLSMIFSLLILATSTLPMQKQQPPSPSVATFFETREDAWRLSIQSEERLAIASIFLRKLGSKKE